MPELIAGELVAAAVVDARVWASQGNVSPDEATLTRMWADADAMPSWPELEEPRLWLARTV